jgi:ribonuclease P protein component
VLVACPTDQEMVRIGVVAGRPVGKAVQRNRAKRLLRAAAQPFLPLMKSGFDLVLIARKPLVEANYSAVHTAVGSLMKRAGCLREVDDV